MKIPHLKVNTHTQECEGKGKPLRNFLNGQIMHKRVIENPSILPFHKYLNFNPINDGKNRPFYINESFFVLP